MRTLIIFNDFEYTLKFLIVPEDLSKFHGVNVNSMYGTGFEEEFYKWMYDEEGERRDSGWTSDTKLIESKDWDKVAICTFLP